MSSNSIENVCTLSMPPPTEGSLLARLCLGGVAILVCQFFETVTLAGVLTFTRVLCALAGRLTLARIHAITVHLGLIGSSGAN
jgi:hypothetical protein